MKIKAIDGKSSIYQENGNLKEDITFDKELTVEGNNFERGVSAKMLNSNLVKTVTSTESTIFFEEEVYNKDNKQKYLIDNVIDKNKKMSYAAVKNTEGNLTAAGISDVIQDNYTKADSGVFVYNGLTSTEHQEEVTPGATKSTEGAIVIKKASGSKPKELKRDEYPIFSDIKEKSESVNTYYNKGINANLFSGSPTKEEEKYWNQVGQQITNSFKNAFSNYFAAWQNNNFFDPEFWQGTAKTDTTRTANAFGKIRSLREQEEYNLQYNYSKDEEKIDEDNYKLQYIPLNEQLASLTTKTLNPSVNVTGSMGTDLRGPLASPSYIDSIATSNTNTQWEKYGIMTANAGIGIANQFINNLGLSSTAELINGLVRGAASEDFFDGFSDSVNPNSLTAAEILQLNAATYQNFYTSKPGVFVKYAKSSHNEVANIYMFPETPTRGDYESNYKKLNINAVRAKQMEILGNYGNLKQLMDKHSGIPFFANDENFRFNSTTNSWGTESESTNQTLFGVSGDNSGTEIAEMIASLLNKNNSYKQLGRVYVKINPASGIKDGPLEIPFEFTPIITENANSAKYQSESLLGRIGAWHMYTGTDLGGITLTTTYIPLASDSLDETESVNKKKQFGLDNWQYYWTQNRINQIELQYRSLVLPTYGEDLVKPPVIEIELGEQGSHSLDNFFKHPIGGLSEVKSGDKNDGNNINNKNGDSNDLTYSEDAKKYLKYTRFFDNNEDDYHRIRKSYVVTSCQISPLDENGYYNMYGAYRSNYNKKLSTTLEQKNTSFHKVEDNDGQGWMYGVTTRGFKVTIQCLEIKENIMDLYPDFKYYYDSVNSLNKNFTAAATGTEKLTSEQVKAIAEMGITYLGSNSQAQLKILLDNVLLRFKAKSAARKIVNKVWEISKFFYGSNPYFYTKFGKTLNEENKEDYKNTKEGGSNPYFYTKFGKTLNEENKEDYKNTKEGGSDVGGRKVLDFKNTTIFSSFNEFTKGRNGKERTLQEFMEAAGMTEIEYKRFFSVSGNDVDVSLIPDSNGKYFSQETISNIKSKYAVAGVGSTARSQKGQDCIVYELDKEMSQENNSEGLEEFFDTAIAKLNNIKINLENAFPEFEDSYTQSENFIDTLKRRVSQDEIKSITVSIKALNDLTDEQKKDEEGNDSEMSKTISDKEHDLFGNYLLNGSCTYSITKLENLENLLNNCYHQTKSHSFRMDGVLAHFKNTNRKTSAFNVVNAAIKTVENNKSILNKLEANKIGKPFQAISVSGQKALITNKLNPIKVSFDIEFTSRNAAIQTFTKKYAMTLDIDITAVNLYQATVVDISNNINSTYQALKTSTLLAVVSYLKENISNNKDIKEVGKEVVSVINKLGNSSTINEIDGAIQTLQSFCNPDEANEEIVGILGGNCGEAKFNNYENASPSWKEIEELSNPTGENILTAYKLQEKGQLDASAALSNIKYNEETETYQSKARKDAKNNDITSDVSSDEWKKLLDAIAKGSTDENGRSSSKPAIYNTVESIYNEQLDIERMGRLQGLNLK